MLLNSINTCFRRNQNATTNLHTRTEDSSRQCLRQTGKDGKICLFHFNNKKKRTAMRQVISVYPAIVFIQPYEKDSCDIIVSSTVDEIIMAIEVKEKNLPLVSSTKARNPCEIKAAEHYIYILCRSLLTLFLNKGNKKISAA